MEDFEDFIEEWSGNREFVHEDGDTIIVPTSYKEFRSDITLGVKVGTTGYKGRDSGHGGRSILKLNNVASTDIKVSINGSGYYDVHEVGICVGGDAELETLIQALEYAVVELKSKAL